MKRLENVIRRYTSIAAVIDMLRRRKLALLNPESWDDRNDRYFMSLYKAEREIGGLYGLCAAQCSETYHHWKIFTSGADGACIEIKRQPLEAMLASVAGVRFDSVEYLALEKAQRLSRADLDRLPFYKRHGFTDEMEYRIIAETDEPQQGALYIDFPPELIGRIELNPWLPASVAESLIAVLKSVSGDSDIKVRRSFLIDNGQWKRAGDQVVNGAK